LSQTDRQGVSIRKIDCHFGLKVLNGAEKRGKSERKRKKEER
jgi:hypothetical protein